MSKLIKHTPQSKNNRRGKVLYWTRERVIDAMRRIAEELDPLPTSDDKYNDLKKGRYDWPSANDIYRHFHGFPEAFSAAGVNPKRISMQNHKWNEDELEYLLEFAGTVKLIHIARHLRRSYASIRRKLYSLKTKARHNQGYLSAAEFAREYDCPYSRVLKWLNTGKLPAKMSKIRNEWQIDTDRIDDNILSLIRKPQITHKNIQDRGDYERRHGLVRKSINGKVVRIKESVPC